MSVRPVRYKKVMQSKKAIISHFQVSGRHKQEVTSTHINKKIDVSIIKDIEHTGEPFNQSFSQVVDTSSNFLSLQNHHFTPLYPPFAPYWARTLQIFRDWYYSSIPSIVWIQHTCTTQGSLIELTKPLTARPQITSHWDFFFLSGPSHIVNIISYSLIAITVQQGRI